MFQRISSTNPHLSYMLQKNPERLMVVRPLRKGFVMGWFGTEQDYCIAFRETAGSHSFGGELNQSDISRFASPIGHASVLQELIAYRKTGEADKIGFSHELLLSSVIVRRKRYLTFFQSHFKGIELEVVEQALDIYQVVFRATGERTLSELIQVVLLFLLFAALFNGELMEWSPTLKEKYIRMMNGVGAPYFIRYLFISSFVLSSREFQRWKVQLETSSTDVLCLVGGNTQKQRRTEVEKHLTFKRSIIDVGCGEGFYALSIAPRLPDHLTYYAIDTDEQQRDTVRRRATERHQELQVLESVEEAIAIMDTREEVEVLMVEVIEHMEKPAAAELIQAILRHFQVRALILTTPNRSFNQHYHMEPGTFRHEDHRWEDTTAEFQLWLRQVVSESDWLIEDLAVGDCVNGEPVTQGAVIRPRPLIGLGEPTNSKGGNGQ